MHQYLCRKKWKLLLFFVALGIAQIMGTGFALIMSSFVDSAGQDADTVLRKLLEGIVYVIICAGFDAVYMLVENSLRKDARVHLKEDLFAAIMKKPVKEFEGGSNAEYLNELSNNFNTYEELYFNNMLRIPPLVIMFVTAASVCVYLEPMMLLLMIGLAVVTLISTKLTTKPLENSSRRMTEASESYMEEIKDDFGGYRAIRSFGILHLILNRHKKANTAMEQEKLVFMNRRVFCMYVGELVGLLSTVLVMGVAAYYAVKGVFAPGMVIAFGHLVGQVVSPITQLPQVVANYRAAKPLTEKFAEILKVSEEACGVEKASFDTAIVMDGLSFSYDGNRKLLGGLTTTFEKGRRYAVVGESGSGKTTLFHLLMGAYSGYEGTLAMDGIELRELSQASIQRLIGVVSQDTFLFHDTLYNNVTMFRSDFTEEEVHRALEKAGLSAFVDKLPDGLQTIVSENGQNLSGGEKQRIGIARVLLNKNPIMLFDEPTANLDEKNTRDIEEHIFAIPDRTIIMITHKTDEERLKRFDGVIQIR